MASSSIKLNGGKFRIPYKNFNITYHARERAQQRLGITDQNELKRLAAKAKYDGLNIFTLRNRMSDPDYQPELKFPELTPDIKKELAHNARHLSGGNVKAYYYNNYVWVFFGETSSTLKTVFKLYSQEELN